MKPELKSNKDYATLAELALELKINKSNLSYYRHIGLLKPVMVVGRVGIFSRKGVEKALEGVKRLKKQGKTLKEVVGNS